MLQKDVELLRQILDIQNNRAEVPFTPYLRKKQQQLKRATYDTRSKGEPSPPPQWRFFLGTFEWRLGSRIVLKTHVIVPVHLRKRWHNCLQLGLEMVSFVKVMDVQTSSTILVMLSNTLHGGRPCLLFVEKFFLGTTLFCLYFYFLSSFFSRILRVLVAPPPSCLYFSLFLIIYYELDGIW